MCLKGKQEGRDALKLNKVFRVYWEGRIIQSYFPLCASMICSPGSSLMLLKRAILCLFRRGSDFLGDAALGLTLRFYIAGPENQSQQPSHNKEVSPAWQSEEAFRG